MSEMATAWAEASASPKALGSGQPTPEPQRRDMQCQQWNARERPDVASRKLYCAVAKSAFRTRYPFQTSEKGLIFR